jgi:hypothetical protein
MTGRRNRALSANSEKTGIVPVENVQARIWEIRKISA